MSSIKHRFDILFTRKQVNDNLHESAVYNRKMPLALFAIIHTVLSFGIYGGVAFIIRDAIGGPMTMKITLLYIFSIYLAIRNIRKQFAKRNVLMREQLYSIERDILQDIHIMDNQSNSGYKANVSKETRRKLRRYHMVYPALITPSNKEVIMHKRHIKSIEKAINVIDRRIASDDYFLITHHKRMKQRRVILERKLTYHKNAISINTIQRSIHNFFTIQDKMKKFDPSYKHRAKTLRFKLHKLKAVREVQNLFIGYVT